MLQKKLFDHALALGIVTADKKIEDAPADLAAFRRRKRGVA
jgi:hypothetical protein